MKKQYDNLKLRCHEHEQRIQQLVTLLNEKQIIIDDLNAEKRYIKFDIISLFIDVNFILVILKWILRQFGKRHMPIICA